MRTESNPFGTLQREVDRLFDEFVRGVAGTNGSLLMPSTDVVETDKAFEISIELPGLERNDIDISADDGNLVIRGEKKAETEKKDNNYHIAERSYGMFYRSVPLPAGVDPEAIQATMSKGVLKITIPKPAHSQAKKIEVKEAA
jgi:HSP20 family protein